MRCLFLIYKGESNAEAEGEAREEVPFGTSGLKAGLKGGRAAGGTPLYSTRGGTDEPLSKLCFSGSEVHVLYDF